MARTRLCVLAFLISTSFWIGSVDSGVLSSGQRRRSNEYRKAQERSPLDGRWVSTKHKEGGRLVPGMKMAPLNFAGNLVFWGRDDEKTIFVFRREKIGRLHVQRWITVFRNGILIPTRVPDMVGSLIWKQKGDRLVIGTSQDEKTVPRSWKSAYYIGYFTRSTEVLSDAYLGDQSPPIAGDWTLVEWRMLENANEKTLKPLEKAKWRFTDYQFEIRLSSGVPVRGTYWATHGPREGRLRLTIHKVGDIVIRPIEYRGSFRRLPTPELRVELRLAIPMSEGAPDLAVGDGAKREAIYTLQQVRTTRTRGR